MIRTVKLYTDESLLRPGAGIHWLLRPLLNPELVSICGKSTDLSHLGAFERIVADYNRQANSLFSLSRLDDCDAAVVPVYWDEVRGGFSWVARPDRGWISAIQNFAVAAQRAGKPVIVFFSEGRSHEQVPVPGAIVFRHALFRSRRSSRDHAMPVMIIADPMRGEFADLLEAQREWCEKPTVGFCGFARDVRLSEHFKSLAYKAYMAAKFGHPDVSPYLGIRLRNQILRVLEKSEKVDTNFLIRTESVFLTQDKTHETKKSQYRREFFENIADSDYQLSMRGSANHSRRPWETLACGRLPAFVDTDCVLPFEGLIKWEKYMPIVTQSEIESLPEAICDFHVDVGELEFPRLQRQCRTLWEEWLSPHGFARQLRNHFERLVLRPG